VSATANVVIIAAIIKVGPSTHDVRHQTTLGLLPRSLVTAITSCMLMSLSVRQRPSGVTRTVLWMRTQFLHINRRFIAELVMLEDWLASLSARRVSRIAVHVPEHCETNKNTQAKSSADT
jgi:hypothetical protein